MINPQRWEAAHEQDIETVCTELGIELRGGKAHCPFHSDKTPSFSIWKRNLAHCFSCAATKPKDGTWDSVRLVCKMRPEMSRYDALLFVENLFGLPTLPDEPGVDRDREGRKPRGWICESLDRLRVICANHLEKKMPGTEKCLEYLQTRQLDLEVVLNTGVIGAVPPGLDVAPIVEAAREAYEKYPLEPLFSAAEMEKASAAKREDRAKIEQARQEEEQKKFAKFLENLNKVPSYVGMLAIFYQDEKDDFVHVEFISGRGKDRKIYSIKPDRAGVFAARIQRVSVSKKRDILFAVEGWANLIRLWSEQARLARADGKDWETYLWDGVALGSAAHWDSKAIVALDSGSKANQSLLCQVCTTGAVSMRALYETNKLVSYPVVSELYMTGLGVPTNFKNDLQNRLLEFPMMPFPQDGKSETERQEEFLASRPALIAETLARLQLILQAERAEAKLGAKYQTNFRIKDFGLFLLRQAHYGGFLDEVEGLLEKVVERQQQNVIEGTDISPLLTLLVGRYSTENGNREMSATLLCSKLDEMATTLRTKNPFSGNARGLGKFLKENADEFAAKFGLVLGTRNGDHSTYSFKPSEEQLESLKRQLALEGYREGDSFGPESL